MEVILLERIDKLGQMGDVVNVKSGYARNFLLPQKKALRATDANKQHFDDQRAQLEASNLEHRTDAENLGKKMDGLSVIMIRQAGDSGQLYGSVNSRDIANAVTEAGFTVGRQQVELAQPIKTLGLFDVQVSLHPEVKVTVIATVALSEDEAKTQAKTGVATVSAEDEQAKADDAGQDQAEEAADEAVVDQAEAIFEEGAAPKLEPEDESGDTAEDEAADEAGDKAE
jgi:large subunit ribosomal protein L9